MEREQADHAITAEPILNGEDSVACYTSKLESNAFNSSEPDSPSPGLHIVDLRERGAFDTRSQSSRGSRFDEPGAVWSNRTVFMLIEQYRTFKDILDDKQHAKKPVWERIAHNLNQQGINVTPTQCSQKWRNMMLQRRLRRLKVLMGQSPTSRAMPQPWEELLESVAPPVDDDAVSRMSIPQRPLLPPPTMPTGIPRLPLPYSMPNKCQFNPQLKRRRTEEALKRSLVIPSLIGWPFPEQCAVSSPEDHLAPQSIDSPSGSSEPHEEASPPSPKAPRLPQAKPTTESPPSQLPSVPSDGTAGSQPTPGDAKNDSVARQLAALAASIEQMKQEQTAFQQRQEEAREAAAERDERRLQLFEQFLGLFGQAIKMFTSFDH